MCCQILYTFIRLKNMVLSPLLLCLYTFLRNTFSPSQVFFYFIVFVPDIYGSLHLLVCAIESQSLFTSVGSCQKEPKFAYQPHKIIIDNKYMYRLWIRWNKLLLAYVWLDPSLPGTKFFVKYHVFFSNNLSYAFQKLPV